MNSQKIDAVLPLTLNDYERFGILYKSLKLFFKDLRRLWVVVPDKEFNEIKSLLTGKDEKVLIIPEAKVVPEFRIFRRTSGWFKQQLIKIAIAEKIETEFYLTLDSDVICVKPTSFSDLVKNGLAPCYRAKNIAKPSWYEWTERVLGFQAPAWRHNLTPAILNKEAMLKLEEYLSQRALKIPLSFEDFKIEGRKDLLLLISNFLCRIPVIKRKFTNWRVYLLRSLPWTEYALYYCFLEEMSLFEKYHYQSENPISSIEQTIRRNNKENFVSWNPAAIFNKDTSYFFVVIQSNTGISSSEIWEKVHTYLDP